MKKYKFGRLEENKRLILLHKDEQEPVNNEGKAIVSDGEKIKLVEFLEGETEHECDRHSYYFLVRKATPEEEEKIKKLKEKEKKAYRYCINRIQIRQLPIKLIKVEFLLDNSKAIFFYSADGRIDFRDLVKDLAGRFKMRIEMRQVGIRDQAKLMGGIGPCGRELCCCTFIKKFEPVSIKVAKQQGLGFNINKVSGFCGRLMCCLQYERNVYEAVAGAETIEIHDKDIDEGRD
ncbi:MAG: hypothetical protein A2Y62_21150 [Candidatus Fischerbacteria bacterium RBG_13_37_8]|uniref:PSP1 C-terminal domain-containing protein n=1 Tax=Candidatus Fischerbacteria bacterium RBG_13_37_8 TaxID=1817863 RepID=A0A1F5V6G9_9BACT|nr:MAG: hypothetical protein A2Y62_21150 [Candidatus Fischerbacteria bacterium RBG_13_37_8]